MPGKFRFEMIGLSVAVTSLTALSASAQGYQSTPAQQPYFAQPQQGMMGQPMPQGQQPARGDEVFKLGPGSGPVVVPPISFVDISSGRFGKLDLDLQDGQFLDAAVDDLHLVAKDLDLNTGVLKSLNIDVKGGHFQDFIFDELTLDTQGDMNFDTGAMLNHKVLQFTQPAQAQVMAVISQNSLNQFLSSPQTLQRLSVTASNKGVGMIASMMGANASSIPNIGVNLTGANVVIGKGSRVLTNLQSTVGMGQMGIPVNLTLDTKLGLKDGWVNLYDTHLNTNGQEISPQLSEMVVKKVNSLADWQAKNDDIHFSFTDLQVVPGKKFVLRGSAQVNRLRFGRG